MNREKRRRTRINEGIEMEDWKEYFLSLLKRIEERVMGGGRNREGEGEEETEIDRKKIREAIIKLKNGKAIGGDGIPEETWKYRGEALEEWIWRFCNEVWIGEGWSES